MAIATIKKIQLITTRDQKNKILDILQNSGVTNIIETSESQDFIIDRNRSINDLQKAELTCANIEFAINLLSNYTKKPGLLAKPLMASLPEIEEKVKDFDHNEIVEKCTEIEEKIIQAKNNLSQFKNEKEQFSPWKKLSTKVENITETDYTKTIIGILKTTVFSEAFEKLHKTTELISTDIVEKNNVENYLLITFDKNHEKEIRKILSEYKFQEAELPKTNGLIKEYLEKLDEQEKENENDLKTQHKELRKLSRHLDNLKYAHDYHCWKLEKLETERNIGNTDNTFIINAWIPKSAIPHLEEELKNKTKEFSIHELALEKEETPPVIMRNSNFFTPFEAVSKIYGLPKYSELDPTPFLAAYFIIFFALCLTDAGYGLVMFIGMYLINKFFVLAEGIKKLVRLLMYGGIVTFFIGAVFGGWFGLTPDQVPEFLTYTSASGEQFFIFQQINALSNPIAVLILALALGYVQVTMGVVMKFIHGFKYGDKQDKKDAVLSDGTWVFMLLGIAFFILTMTGVLPTSLSAIGKWWVIIAAILLVLTQGRDKGNIVLKFFSGVLSLYGLVGYMSDILSYSRILALGLATAIIGLAVNIVAELVGGLPYIGWLLMIVVFIGGHLFNLLLNALGSFIHSGRLQFVEFFTKFMEGGGAEFKPFSRKSKYVVIKNN